MVGGVRGGVKRYPVRGTSRQVVLEEEGRGTEKVTPDF